MTDPQEDAVEQENECLRKELEGVRRELDRSGADFEEFISIAAHNLRQSLRDIVCFGQLMAENYAGRLDSDADMFLGRIQEAAGGMQSLLSDVVDYWGTRTGDWQSCEVEMEAALRQALLFAEKQIAERGAIVVHDPLPRVHGDCESLAKVLHHLIRNGIEYCLAPCPSIHISARRVDLDWVFSVQDNGPGVEPAFQKRIFGAFRRLHGKGYPGNGLGLALCKRIVEWHGGRMWMETASAGGSIFCFTLPAGE